jgi:hypothetical protein
VPIRQLRLPCRHACTTLARAHDREVYRLQHPRPSDYPNTVQACARLAEDQIRTLFHTAPWRVPGRHLHPGRGARYGLARRQKVLSRYPVHFRPSTHPRGYDCPTEDRAHPQYLRTMIVHKRPATPDAFQHQPAQEAFARDREHPRLRCTVNSGHSFLKQPVVFC